jgi:OHCU decarboxylase
MRGIARLNALPAEQAETELLNCCGSAQWAQRMAARRPFAENESGLRELLDAADRIWRELGRADWLEAFSRHPKIGEKAAAKPGSAQARSWSEQEQSGASGAGEDVRQALADANREYEKRFGYIFIVCATGKTSEEMLAILRQRLQNGPDTELPIAAEEQRKITRLRLEKLLSG